MSMYVHREEQHSWARQPSHKRKHDAMVQEEATEFVSEVSHSTLLPLFISHSFIYFLLAF